MDEMRTAERLARPTTPVAGGQPTLARAGVLPTAGASALGAACQLPPRRAGDFSRVRVTSQPRPAAPAPPTRPPPPLPTAPTPRPGEQPVGTHTNRETSATEPIYASFVQRGIWWFNGAVPTVAALYPSEADIDTGLGPGQFDYRVTAGSSKLGFVRGTSTTATLSGNNLPRVGVRALGPSTKSGDVTITVSHRPQGARRASTSTVNLEVRAPHHLDLLRTEHSALGTQGFSSRFFLRLFDNFGMSMPYMDVNEDFDQGTLKRGVSTEWQAPFRARTKGKDVTAGSAMFQDRYQVSVTGGAAPATMRPAPSNPLPTLGTTRVGTFTHDWYAGAGATGQGVHVSRHTGVFFSDHGEYTNFRSHPPARRPAAGGPTTP